MEVLVLIILCFLCVFINFIISIIIIYILFLHINAACGAGLKKNFYLGCPFFVL